jgi:catechol 2,3-dioxygenase-like lactoylglutathione lyase family enzyme
MTRRRVRVAQGFGSALRTLAGSAALLILAASLAARPGVAAAPNGEAIARAVTMVGMTVSDLDRAAAFFEEVLTFRRIAETEVYGDSYERLTGVFGARMRIARLQLGDEILELTEYLAPRGRPIPPDARSNDLAFQHVAIIVSNMDEAYRRLRGRRVEHASTGPQTLPAWNPAAGGISAFYFKDPDGHALEILQFPSGKGDARWQRADALFLGIDHTAIVVGDTDESLGFYRDTLGMRLAGESENYGTEQEHLNNVFGARLRITTLRAAAGPGVELLEYLAPSGGRPAPDVRSNDLAHWHTVVATDDLRGAERRLFRARADFVSPGAIDLGGRELGFPAAMRLRDPDGHAVQVVAR